MKNVCRQISVTFKCMCEKTQKSVFYPLWSPNLCSNIFLCVCVLIIALRGIILYILTNEWHNKVQAAYPTGFGCLTEHKWVQHLKPGCKLYQDTFGQCFPECGSKHIQHRHIVLETLSCFNALSVIYMHSLSRCFGLFTISLISFSVTSHC